MSQLNPNRKPHRCSIKADPPPAKPPGWAMSPEEWAEDMRKFVEIRNRMPNARRSLRKS